ncbi:terpene cyclase [Sorangium cellulosum]|uniref:Terpene synthase n=1 Tax=Sorangium cellulosum TaxID=56 RepID=A0A4P2QC15_SORCE|nr:terpene cyclase [Sorangium cellulosum]AUX27270.1 terpene cyclase [Sorangium cellulosum]
MRSDRTSIVVRKNEEDRFDYPFSASCHPKMDVVERRTVHWVRRLRLLTDDRALARIKAAGVAQLAAWVFPSASVQTLQLASDFTAVLFLLDDIYDEGELSSDPRAVAKLNERYLGELFGYVEADMDDPLTRGLLDIRDRLRRGRPHFFLNRWLSHFQYYYEANLWEANNRARRRIPHLDEYIMMRRYSGAVYPYCDLVELLLDQPLPLEIVQHPLLQRVRDICNDLLCWTNDYFSLEKELRSGEVHNLILVLRDRHKITLEEAVAQLRRMHDDRVAEYQDVKEKALSSWSTGGIRQYLGAIDDMIAGHQRWALAALRYSEPGGEIARAG